MRICPSVLLVELPGSSWGLLGMGSKSKAPSGLTFRQMLVAAEAIMGTGRLWGLLGLSLTRVSVTRDIMT